MKKVLFTTIIFLLSVTLYGLIGTSSNVEEIKRLAPESIRSRGWEILRYEGFQYGSYGKHGGKVWYHVRDVKDHDIQYRVHITLWGDELQYYYGSPETLKRINSKDLSLIKLTK